MKASELIEFLEELMDKHGNGDVFIKNNNGVSGVSYKTMDYRSFKLRSTDKFVDEQGWYEIS